MIRADLTLVPDPAANPGEGVPAPLRRGAGTNRTSAKAPETQVFPPPAPVPSWARATGRAGQGGPLFAAGASLALLDAHLRRDPPFAGALRQRLALTSAGACAKILRLNADESALRDLRFAVGDAGPAARLLQLWRDLAGRPPSLDPSRLAAAAARLDLAVDPNDLASSLKACAGEGDPVSAAARAAAFAFSTFPDAPAAEAEILALWAFDLALAIRLRWARPLPLIAAKILDPTLRAPDASRRPKPGDPAWPNTAAGAIALAAASALDHGGRLRRARRNPRRAAGRRFFSAICRTSNGSRLKGQWSEGKGRMISTARSDWRTRMRTTAHLRRVLNWIAPTSCESMRIMCAVAEDQDPSRPDVLIENWDGLRRRRSRRAGGRTGCFNGPPRTGRVGIDRTAHLAHYWLQSMGPGGKADSRTIWSSLDLPPELRSHQ